MARKIILSGLLFLLSSCVSLGIQPGRESTPTVYFVTSTLPPTKQAFVPATLTPEAIITPTVEITAAPNCKDGAIMLRDVTIPDETIVHAGEKFTKTWELQNTGTCPWVNFSLAFAFGDQMGAPLSVPVPTTLAKEKVEVSVELTAPLSGGTYTGYYQLHNASEKIVPIGTEQSFWVKIIVGGAGAVSNATTMPSTPGSATPISQTPNPGKCNFTSNASYTNQLFTLINAERSKASLPALSLNALLSDVAQGHAADMACNNMISHGGSDGSTPYSRVTAAGYGGHFYEEIIYGGGGPEAAIIWWMNDPIHRDAILRQKTTEMGIGYAYFSNGAYGDFITVEFGSP